MDTSLALETMLRMPAEDWGDWLLEHTSSEYERTRIADALLGTRQLRQPHARVRRLTAIAMSLLDKPDSD